MKSVIVRAFLVAVASSIASILVAFAAVSAAGKNLDGLALILCIVCPLFIAWPATAYTFWQNDKLKSAHRELSRTHAQLAAAHRRLADKARHDDMTGMLNRESFFATLDRSRRKSDRGALLIIDADHFKSINDRFGHLVGDEALLLIVEALRGGVRSGDVLGRIGGEEFGAFLVGADENEAMRIAERMRQEVEQIRFHPDGDRTIPLTVSIGGTICGEGTTVSDLMRSADRRLYNAKNRGRNLVVFERDMPEAA
ncbi:diguanylate cyclase [Mesorhizobium sp. Root157]|uniref:GGDEF domain-containing protein n=1 Tax=Mesorhizobium sp. Root157 TaxID=1736477 RepID=UPI0006F95AF4|nr:GGDEF domain-containing protein [Mesorhizobium sp. Root157]KQZ82974.1 diguanylate cyclase [Mesorhizobium sp. Root157]